MEKAEWKHMKKVLGVYKRSSSCASCTRHLLLCALLRAKVCTLLCGSLHQPHQETAPFWKHQLALGLEGFVLKDISTLQIRAEINPGMAANAQLSHSDTTPGERLCADPSSCGTQWYE